MRVPVVWPAVRVAVDGDPVTPMVRGGCPRTAPVVWLLRVELVAQLETLQKAIAAKTKPLCNTLLARFGPGVCKRYLLPQSMC